MHRGEGAGGGKRVQDQGTTESPCDGDDDRQEHHEPGVEEDRETEQQCGHPDGQRRAFLAEAPDQGVRQNLCPAGDFEEPADHDAEAHEEGHRPQSVGESVGQRLGNIGDGNSGRQRREQADQHEGDERVQLHPDDEEQQKRHCPSGYQEQGGCSVSRLDCFHNSSVLSVPGWPRALLCSYGHALAQGPGDHGAA